MARKKRVNAPKTRDAIRKTVDRINKRIQRAEASGESMLIKIYDDLTDAAERGDDITTGNPYKPRITRKAPKTYGELKTWLKMLKNVESRLNTEQKQLRQDVKDRADQHGITPSEALQQMITDKRFDKIFEDLKQFFDSKEVAAWLNNGEFADRQDFVDNAYTYAIDNYADRLWAQDRQAALDLMWDVYTMAHDRPGGWDLPDIPDIDYITSMMDAHGADLYDGVNPQYNDWLRQYVTHNHKYPDWFEDDLS